MSNCSDLIKKTNEQMYWSCRSQISFQVYTLRTAVFSFEIICTMLFGVLCTFRRCSTLQFHCRITNDLLYIQFISALVEDANSIGLSYNQFKLFGIFWSLKSILLPNLALVKYAVGSFIKKYVFRQFMGNCNR